MGTSNYLSIRSDEAVRGASGLAVLEPFPARHSLVTFAAFVVAGFIPLLSYVVSGSGDRFPVAVVLTLATLFAVGAARSIVTRLEWWRSGLEMLLLGSTAAAVAYGVGSFVAAITG
jgi:VIT1/CCC1 family predicted Fe2+/Mn2+ transporter